MKNSRKYVFIFCVVVLLMVSGCSNSADTPESGGESANSGGAAGSGSAGAADESDGKQNELFTLNGKSFEDEDITNTVFSENKLTVLNVWATFCNPCLTEMPVLNELNEEYQNEEGGVEIMGICIDVFDSKGEVDSAQLDLAREIISKTGVNYTNVVPDMGMLTGVLANVSAVPTTYFIDSEGNIVDVVTGARNKEQWSAIIDENLK